MPFTPVDWAIIAIIVISALISLKRGFVKEALSLLTWIIAGVVAWMFGGSLSQYLVSYIETPSARIIAGCTILFVATLLVGHRHQGMDRGPAGGGRAGLRHRRHAVR